MPSRRIAPTPVRAIPRLAIWRFTLILAATLTLLAAFKRSMPTTPVVTIRLPASSVTFRYKEDLDPDKIPQFGLIVEEVEKVDPNLVVRDEDGKVSTVRYEAVNAMLLNEFLKEHRKAQEQERKLQEQEATIR